MRSVLPRGYRVGSETELSPIHHECNRPTATESESKDDLFTLKALPNLAQGNTLGLSGASDPTLKALNNDSMQTTSIRIIKPFQGIEFLKITDPRVLPWAKL
jgi:hypothetical protein